MLKTRAALSLLIALLAACSDPEPDPVKPDMAVTPDMTVADMDAPDEGAADAAPDLPAGPPCKLQADCAGATICANEVCVPSTTCEGVRYQSCVSFLEGKEPGLGVRAICDEGVCRVACELDEQCPQGQTCSEGGECVVFEGQLTGMHPGGGQRAPLQAGVGNVLMKFPIGLSQAGYGSRMQPNDGRYVKALSATHGQMQGLYARAIMLDNGERQLMFIRLPIIFPTFELHEQVARKLQEATGRDWRDSLIISGTHTHSGPGRHYHLPPELELLAGAGTDQFSDEAFGWLVESTSGAALAALADRAPARVGWKIVEGFDTDDEIASDRWSATPAFDDNRMLLLRVDDAQGVPRAVMFSYGSHGTIHDGPLFTEDSSGGAEDGLEERLGREYGRYIPTMYFNENGGTMSPRGDQHGHEDQQRLEQLGYRLVEKAWTELQSLDMKTDVELAGVTHRFPLSYELVGYMSGEWTNLQRRENRFGAIQCSLPEEDNDPSTFGVIGMIRCLLSVQTLTNNRMTALFMRSQLTAASIDGLTLVTLPGEASMELGWQVVREVSAAWGLDPLKTFTLGYAQDHQFYLLPTNLRGARPPFPGFSNAQAPDDYPDFAYSFLQGGYEPSLSPWGYRMGDFLVERAVEAVGLMRKAPVQPKLPPTMPTQIKPRGDEPPFPITTSDPAEVGMIVAQLPATVERLSAVEFAWVGGDPGAEMPQAPRVTLERKLASGAFEEVKTPAMRPYDNRSSRMVTRVRPDGARWVWVIYWEELADFPAGEYRLKVDGHYQGAAGRTAYTTTSSVFAVSPTDSIQITAQTGGAGVIATLGYPGSSAPSFPKPDGDKGKILGGYRMRHPDVPTGAAWPLTIGRDLGAAGVTVTFARNGNQVAQVTGADVTLREVRKQVNGRADVPVTELEIAWPNNVNSGDYQMTISVTDEHGNTGVLTQNITR
jgi:hypothetical protein